MCAYRCALYGMRGLRRGRPSRITSTILTNQEAGMDTKAGRIFFWGLAGSLVLLALFALSYGQREAGWKGEPGLRLTP
jgi:hypothetical protein